MCAYDPIVFNYVYQELLLCSKLHTFLLMLVCAGGLLQIQLILGVLIFISPHGFNRSISLQSLAFLGRFSCTSHTFFFSSLACCFLVHHTHKYLQTPSTPAGTEGAFMTGGRLSYAFSCRWWDFQSAQALADCDTSLFFLNSPSHPCWLPQVHKDLWKLVFLLSYEQIARQIPKLIFNIYPYE